MTTRRLQVIKVGGSLLDWPELPHRLGAWLIENPAQQQLLIAGGGEFTDVIRKADAVHGLGEETSHMLCVEALSVTAGLLGQLMNLPVIEELQSDRGTYTAAPQTRACVLNPLRFLTHDEAGLPGTRLPRTWQATTDSVAARVAVCLGADELVLLKSASPTTPVLAHLAGAGYVDEHFPIAAQGLEVRLVNLRG